MILREDLLKDIKEQIKQETQRDRLLILIGMLEIYRQHGFPVEVEEFYYRVSVSPLELSQFRQFIGRFYK